ncbi:MAG: translation initiation factor IF-2 [Lachnospiraceae bacterium]|nr:translation initiation factor IF-2 [Lachnospiraceae bacterium]
MRVYEYAKSNNKESADVLKALEAAGFAVKTANNNIGEEEIKALNKAFGVKPNGGAKEAEKPAAKVETKTTPVDKSENKPASDNASQPKKVVSSLHGNNSNNNGNNRSERKVVTSTYNPQNSNNGRRDLGGNNRNQNNTSSNKPQEPAKPVERRKFVGANTGNYDFSMFSNDSEKSNDRSNVSKNNENRGNGERRDFNRDNNGNGERRPFNRDNNGNGERRPFNRDNNGNGERRPFNRDNNGNGERRPFNRDNNGNGGERRPFNRDNNGNGEHRPFNRDNNGNGGERRPFNRDNNGNGGERRPFNRDNNGNGGERRPFNRDNNGNGGERRPFNRDGRRNDRDSKPIATADFSVKPDARKVDRRVDVKKEKRNMDERENTKFASNRPGAFIKPVKVDKPAEEEIKTLILPDVLTIKDLADKMKQQPSALVKKLFLQGKLVTINQEIDYDTAEEIAMDYDILCEHAPKVDRIAELLKEEEDDPATLKKRPPVVCVMGHVDHGKTSLLDAIRDSNVTRSESGGITQHIGAYTVEINGEQITFLDTPGHEAFTAMRMRGAQSTDIAILVVAADDGVMPQTIEAINHAKAAGIEIIVAVNKIDKPAANVERVKQELTEYGLISEDWGGTTIFCPVSAHTKQGIPELLENILLVAEVAEFKANPNRKARGLVIEAKLDKGRGPVATILVQKGTLHVGDNVAAGSCHGKIRAMIDDKGNRVKEAKPSTPVEIQGLNDVPNAGEIIVSLDSDKEARSFAETFIAEGKEKLIADTKQKLSLDDLFSQIQAGNLKELNLIVKADVQGSVEAVKSSLLKLSNEEVAVKVIHSGVGNVTESDVVLASASNAIIIAFNVRPDNQAKLVADREKVDLRLYKVIYDAINDVETALKGMLAPKYEEQVIGHLVVRQTFKASGVGQITGAYVSDGRITRDSKVRITRMGVDEVLFEGDLASLKRFKDDAKEVKEGFECGLVFDGFQGTQEDDMIEAYIMVEVPRD